MTDSTMTEEDSTPQAVLVVGGGQGIGLETTKSILSLSCTAKVVAFGLHFDSSVDFLREHYPDRLWTVQGDVRVAGERKTALRVCEKEMKAIDTLVYTAGVITPIERIENLKMEDVKAAFDVNVFGCMAMCQLCLPALRRSRVANFTNAAYGKVLILSSACDADINYHGWMPYCTTKAALTRFIQMLAHEEPLLTVQGVYPKLTRTKMPEDVIAGKYRGVMADHEIERFRVWNEIGDEMVEPAVWCGEAVGKLAVGLYQGGRSGETLYYDEHVPKKIVGT